MRSLANLLALVLLAAAPGAQCFVPAGGAPAGLVATGPFTPAHDEGRSPPIDMQLGAAGFPMPGAAGPWTHCVVDANGVLYLTNGAAANDPIDFGAFVVDDLRGASGASPRVFPCWQDLEGPAPSWAVTVDTSVAGRFRVDWIDVQPYLASGQLFRCSATLFATGAVEFRYGALPPFAAGFAGVSIGNAVGTGAETSVDLTTGPDSGALGLLFQQFGGFTEPSVARRTIALLPNGTGGYQALVTCEPAAHVAFGAGCYDIARESWYQYFADAASASAALQGRSLTLQPAGAGYVVTWNAGGAAGYVPPVNPTNFVRSDDGQHVLDLTLAGLPALPVPGGAATTLYVHDNGFVSTGVGNLGGAWNEPAFDDVTPTPSFRNAPETAFWSWHDYNPFEATGGQIGWHYDAALTKLYLTWQGVENHSTPTAANPSTIQFQFDLGSGQVDYIWSAIDTDTTSPFGSAHLIGYSPGGASLDPGPLDLALDLPIVSAPDVRAMALSVAPAPVINPSTTVTYTIANVPEFAPGSGTHIATLFLSVGAQVPGIDLAAFGAPGCSVFLAALELNLDVPISATSTATRSVAISNVYFAPGDVFFTQAAALFDAAFPLPNGQNAFGVLVSNAVQSTTQLQ
ncbi:MAG: hypothetical protein JNM25_13470 [Planctomycetes bacterium]|nr:hypothetical protein [Planctomycetota bacterium]